MTSIPNKRHRHDAPWARHARMNAAAWDEIAVERRRWFDALGYSAQFFADGKSKLTGAERLALGDVTGKRVLHLQCASGEDTLSLANLQADVTGVDISQGQLEQARHKASEARITNIRFARADVQNLPTEYRTGGFDIVFISTGSLVWIDDLTGWATSISEALRRDGILVLSEEHPIVYAMEEVEDRLMAVHSYFEREPEYDSGWRHFPSDKSGHQKVQFS